MKAADFDFFLPKNLIAKRPLNKRDKSRLLVLHRDGAIEHRRFYDLPSYLNAGDMLFLNNTKVFPARLIGFKPTGGKLELLLIKENRDGSWNVLSKERFTGTLKISEDLHAEVYKGETARFKCSGKLIDIIWEKGYMPLPPYIKRKPDRYDKEKYQTVYASKDGSIAAPTAGLHFTHKLLKDIALKGIIVRTLTLHVGVGTFKPIKTNTIEEHHMYPEYFEIDASLSSEIKEFKKSGRKIIAVGTTTTRAIEGYVSGRFNLLPSNGIIRGETDIFIYPGYRFKVVDSLISNFHLPRSTPLLLTSALCRYEKLMKAYAEAITMGYRFFSYGDAMLIL